MQHTRRDTDFINDHIIHYMPGCIIAKLLLNRKVIVHKNFVSQIIRTVYECTAMYAWLCMQINRYLFMLHDSKGAHLLEQMNNRLKQAAARNVVTAMDFFLPIISSRIKIHMVPGG